MSEEMQPIDPVTAAMFLGETPEPCEPIIEISHKVLTRLMDVVEFGDQLERVEKDRLLAHLKYVLAEEQPELWAMHSVGPGEVHPMISKEEAERQASELITLCKERFPDIPITVNVIPSPFSPLEHFEMLAEELSEQVTDLRNALKQQATPAAVNQQLTTAASVAMPGSLHPDTQDLITRFATALAVKLHAAELKHGYSNGWKDPNWMDECRQKLIEHLTKGDPRDVAAYCAFLWHHCQSTSAPSKPCTWMRDWETGAYQLGCCDQAWHFTDGTAEDNGARFCHHCAGEIVVEARALRAYQVGDNDIVAAYDPAGAIKVLCDFAGYDDEFDEDDVDLVSDKALDDTTAYDQDEGKIVTLEKTLRQELAELTEPAYLHGWE